MRESPYTEKFCKQLVEHLKKGRSFRSFGSIAGVSRATLYNWVKEHEEFNIAKEIGECHSLYHWESDLLRCSKKGMKPTAAIFALKTRFHEDYGDKDNGKGKDGEGKNFNESDFDNHIDRKMENEQS